MKSSNDFGYIEEPSLHDRAYNAKRIEYRITKEGCWEVTSHAIGGNGYGKLMRNGKAWGIHRYVYSIVNGVDLKHEEFVLHTCDNPPCINPQHLEIGSNTDNMRQMVERGRGVFVSGERNGKAKLTDAQAREIKKRKTAKIADLAQEFSVSTRTILRIRHGERYKHID